MIKSQKKLLENIYKLILRTFVSHDLQEANCSDGKVDLV